jgi:glucose/mannose-6-phosphate isomerase
VLPAYVDARSLVLASSNSGNTEEILSATDAAIAAGAKCVVMTTGGKLLEVAQRHGLPVFTYAYTGEPRSALGWSFASLLAICGRAGVLPDAGADLRGAAEHMRSLRREIAADVPEASNAAKRMARRLHGKLPAFIGAEALTPVAYRWRTQVNENAKSWGIADELPEMNHNAQAGYGLAKEALPLLHIVFLRHASAHARVALRVEATSKTMRGAGVATEILDVPGPSVLAQMLWAVHFGDFASYYLSVLNGVDASPVPGIESLKKALAGREPGTANLELKTQN